MSASLLLNGKQQFIDINGNPLVGGTVGMYILNTLIPKNTWTNSGQTILNTNPIMLDSRGQAVIYGVGTYRQIVRDSLGNLIWDQPVTSSGGGASEGGILSLPTIASLQSFADALQYVGSTVSVNGYSTSGDGGGGLFLITNVNPGAANGGTLFHLDVAGTYAVRQFVGAYHSEWWGADNTGVSDSTTAIQNSLNYVGAQGAGGIFGAELIIGPGTFKITSALAVQQWVGLDFHGAGRMQTIISQATNNTPIFKFHKENMWGWKIHDMWLTWATPQSSSNTLSNCFYFSYDTPTSSGVYNFEIYQVTCGNGFRFITTNGGDQSIIWGCNVHDIFGLTTMTGGLFYNVSTPSFGQPNIRLQSIYYRCDSVVATEYIVTLNGSDNFEIHNFEANQSLLGCGLFSFIGGSIGAVGVCKTEGGNYATSNFALVKISDSQVSFDRLDISTLTVNIAGGQLDMVSLLGAAAVMNAAFMSVGDITYTAGKIYCFSGGGAYPTYSARVGTLTGVAGASSIYLTNVGSSATANCVNVESWIAPVISADVGDADYTWTAGISPQTILLATTLTGNRKITIANVETGADSNLFNGCGPKAIRNAAIPGAFTWTIANSAGTAQTVIPANGNGVRAVAYNRGVGFVPVQVDNWTTLPP